VGSLRNGAVRAKVLIWGALGAGKTTTLTYVGSKLKSEQKGKVQKVTIKNPIANYELLPVELGQVKGVKTEMDFMTCPGAWEHTAVRRRLLQGVDGVIFVANSSGSAMKDNQRALAELDEALKAQGRSLVTVPVVFQWMNQKAIGSMPPDEMQAKLNRIGAPTFLVPGDDFSGILKAFATISKMVVKNVRDDYDQGKLAEPASLDLDLDDLPPKVKPGAAAAAASTGMKQPALEEDGGVNPFADMANELGDELEDFDGKLDALQVEPAASPMADAASMLDDTDIDFLAPAKKPEEARPSPAAARSNGSASFKLLGAGTPTLAPDGTLALPIRIGNEHGEEVSMTIRVSLKPS
jgi:signal recognition particle receptor subunit beta